MCNLWISDHKLLESFHKSPLLMLVALLNYVELVRLLSENIGCWELWFVVVCCTALLGFCVTLWHRLIYLFIYFVCFQSKIRCFERKGWEKFWLCISVMDTRCVSFPPIHSVAKNCWASCWGLCNSEDPQHCMEIIVVEKVVWSWVYLCVVLCILHMCLDEGNGRSKD